MVQVLERVCVKSGLKGVTPHVLQHTFASVAGDLGFSELTIAGLLGHSARGVTQGYLHLDAALGVAADRVSAEIEKMLDGRGAAKKSEENDQRGVRRPQWQPKGAAALARDHAVGWTKAKISNRMPCQYHTAPVVAKTEGMRHRAGLGATSRLRQLRTLHSIPTRKTGRAVRSVIDTRDALQACTLALTCTNWLVSFFASDRIAASNQ